ncbi:TRAP transporter small permease subunit [Granulosicoccus sp. 3-233]|uniref:TRAP transporter small permease subunit n=1 Tax=Granulosicoccus sp. 3-233 TaxID=3417969 RepID=UPI003D335BC4
MAERTRSPADPWWMRAISFVSQVCGAVSASMILASVLLTCQMIWVRKINNASTVWQTETVIYLMIGATLIGLPYVQLLKGHVNVDLLPRMLPVFMRKGLACLTLMAAISVIGVMLFYSAELWHFAWSKGWSSDTVWGPPLWIPYLAMPLGFGLYLLQLAADLMAIISNIDEPFPEATH